MRPTLKQRFFLAFYNYFAKHLPPKSFIINLGQDKLRQYCIRNICRHVGKNIYIDDHVNLTFELSIGDNSGIGSRGHICGKITIGDNTLIAPDLIIYTVNHNFRDSSKTIISQGSAKEEPVVIGNDVWIGRKVIILPGVTIGDGAVIGAGAVVAKDIPPYTIAVGNPVQFKGKRSSNVSDNIKADSALNASQNTAG